jgi:hypothetical protein
VPECTSKPAFADAGRATQDDVVVASIQRPSASFWNSARSRPRVAR